MCQESVCLYQFKMLVDEISYNYEKGEKCAIYERNIS